MISYNGCKKCSKCQCIYPIIMFHVQRCEPDGLCKWCKYCKHLDKQNPQVREKSNKRNKDKYMNDPEYRATILANQKNKWENDPEYRMKSINRNRDNQKIIDSLKQGFGCSICGYNEYPESLDFHHINPKEKKFCINIGTIAKESIFIEI